MYDDGDEGSYEMEREGGGGRGGARRGERVEGREKEGGGGGVAKEKEGECLREGFQCPTRARVGGRRNCINVWVERGRGWARECEK